MGCCTHLQEEQRTAARRVLFTGFVCAMLCCARRTSFTAARAPGWALAACAGHTMCAACLYLSWSRLPPTHAALTRAVWPPRLPQQVFEWVMCSDEAADSHRFMDVLDAAIQAKEAPSFAKYAAWAKRVAARPRPKPGSGSGKAGGRGKKAGKAGGGGDEAALVAAIRGRQGGALARIGGGGGGVLGVLMRQMGGDIENIPSEEDFLAARARLEGKKGASAGKQKAGGGSSGRKGAGDSGSKQKAAAGSAAGSSSKRAKKS